MSEHDAQCPVLRSEGHDVAAVRLNNYHTTSDDREG